MLFISDDISATLPQPSISARQHCLRESSHLALARYHLISHPEDPTRLTKLLLIVNNLQRIMDQETVVATFFNNDAMLVQLFVSNVLLQH